MCHDRPCCRLAVTDMLRCRFLKASTWRRKKNVSSSLEHSLQMSRQGLPLHRVQDSEAGQEEEDQARNKVVRCSCESCSVVFFVDAFRCRILQNLYGGPNIVRLLDVVRDPQSKTPSLAPYSAKMHAGVLPSCGHDVVPRLCLCVCVCVRVCVCVCARGCLCRASTLRCRDIRVHQQYRFQATLPHPHRPRHSILHLRDSSGAAAVTTLQLPIVMLKGSRLLPFPGNHAQGRQTPQCRQTRFVA